MTAFTAIADRLPGSARVRRRVLATAVVAAAWPLAAVVLPDGAPVGVVLQGAVFGTVTALLGMGLILTYRTNRIINFAYASMGGVGGVLAVHLFLEAGWNYFAAIAAGVATGLVVGGLVEFLVIRRFANSSRLIATVATIGLAQVLGGIELYIPRLFDSAGLVGGFATPFDFGFSIDPVRFTGDHLLIVAAVPPIIAGLAWFLLRTDAGVAVRAAAENRDRALLLGIPIRRLTTIVWIIAGGLAALTAVLKAPFAGSVSTALGGPTLLLPAIAAAVIARMESLPVAFGAGVGLGVLEQVVFWNTGKASTIDVAFLVVILLALLAQRGRLSRAEDADGGTWSMTEVFRRIPAELRSLPEVRATRALLAVAVVAGAVLLPLTWSVSTLNLATTALVWGMVAVSLVVLTGWGGNISLGQFAIVGLGAVVAGNLVVRYNLDLFVALLFAGVAGAVVALLVGVPALRIRGLFLAATTLAFAVAFDSYLLNPNNFPELIQESVTRPILWERWDLEGDLPMYYLTLALLALSILLTVGVRKARTGRVVLATRDNQRAAAAAGVPTTSVKLTAFMFSGFVAGLAGALFVVHLHGTRMGTFQPLMSLEVFSMAVIGGIGSIGGALLGVGVFRWLEQVLSGELRLVVTGAGLLFVLMVIPGGLMQPLYRIRDVLLRKVAQRRGILVPSLVEDRRIDDEGGEGRAVRPAITSDLGAVAEADDDGAPSGGRRRGSGTRRRQASARSR